ncbi:TrkA C-terminal domain-containing protein [Halorarius litoreus]|uniref:TrkA C-terminal domain-containing protein n=1 Tax=Halorarius litoreus TaxID=2962676 RepID=UPI0020CC9938|nr:TrkA C-terminal domain-containing protein [Halorarius litoreus]
MSGQGNLQVKVVASDTGGLSHIARKLTNLGLAVEDEEFIQAEYHHPFHDFGPDDDHETLRTEMEATPNDEIVVIAEDAPVADQTLQEANRAGLIHEDLLVIAIQRGDRILTPRGNTVLKAGDRVKIFSPARIPPGALDTFQQSE